MDDESALHAAIRADPDADTPRLVYADWLDDRGDADRAAYIRLQCQAARLPPRSRARRQKEKAADALLAAHRADWLGPLPDAFTYRPGERPRRLVLDRGMISELDGPIEVVARLAADLNRLAPCLRRLTLSHLHGDPSPALDLPILRLVRELDLRGLGDDVPRILAGHPSAARLDRLGLEFEFDRLGNSLAPLADAPLVRSAGRIDLRFEFHFGYDDDDQDLTAPAEPDTTGDPIARELARLDLPNLRGLGFPTGNPRSVEALAVWDGLARLDALDLDDYLFGEGVLAELLRMPNLPRLRRLGLVGGGLGELAARALAHCRKLDQLTTLRLGFNRLTDPDAEAMAESPNLPPALDLDVRRNHLTKWGVEVLRDRFGPGVVADDQLPRPDVEDLEE